MNPKELVEYLSKSIPAGLNTLIVSEPGCGKSAIVAQVAEILGYELVTTHPVISDPTDYKGLPFAENGYAEFLLFGQLRSLTEPSSCPRIYFMDDIGQAPFAVQAALMQLVWAREIDGKKIADDVVFLAASNYRKNKAGVGGLIEPFKSRFAAILKLDVNINYWSAWAVKNGIRSEIIAFLTMRPELLSKPEPSLEVDVVSPNPRRWEFASDILNLNIKDDILLNSLEGCVGEGPAGEFFAYLDMYKELPDVKSIAKDPMNTSVPQNISARTAVALAIVEHINKQNCHAYWQYLSRMDEELFVTASKLIVERGDTALLNSPVFVQWAQENQDVLF